MRTPEISRAQLEAAVAVANVPALLMVIYQFSGDPAWLSEEFRPSRGKGLDDNDDGGLSPGTQMKIRAAAVDVLMREARGEAPAFATLSAEQMVTAMSVYLGEAIRPEYGQMLATEFGRRTGYETEPLTPVTPPPGFKVAIVGAGVGGISAARHCQQLGVDFVVLEKAPSAGGVWLKNSYPGAGVDTPSHLYSLSFARNDWTTHFALRDEIHQYLSHTVEALVNDGADVRFNVTVDSMRWCEDRQKWDVTTHDATGIETVSYDAVITSVGGLDQPSLPNIPGADEFGGAAFHSARWPDDLDLSGKRVAVVGTGASAMQIVPAIAPKVEHLTIVQRSPQWVAPFPKFRKGIPEELRVLLATSRLYYGWYWLRLFWQFGDNVLASLRRDPDWAHPDRSVNARNDAHRMFFADYIQRSLGDRQDLLPNVLPDYPPFGKRILLDNGWYETLQRANVSLVAEGVVRLEKTALVTESSSHEVDVVVWATGFEASRFLASMEVVGKNGVSLREAWDDDDPKAFMGLAVPSFPNLFMLGGPNAFPGSGSIMFWLELQSREVARLLGDMVRRRATTIEVTEAAHSGYNERIDSEHEQMIWTHPGMRTYYRNARGRVVFVSPFRNVDFWGELRSTGLEAFHVDPHCGAPGNPAAMSH